MPERGHCCSCCRLFDDGFNRDDSTEINTPGKVWTEQLGDWEIRDRKLQLITPTADALVEHASPGGGTLYHELACRVRGDTAGDQARLFIDGPGTTYFGVELELGEPGLLRWITFNRSTLVKTVLAEQEVSAAIEAWHRLRIVNHFYWTEDGTGIDNRVFAKLNGLWLLSALRGITASTNLALGTGANAGELLFDNVFVGPTEHPDSPFGEFDSCPRGPCAIWPLPAGKSIHAAAPAQLQAVVTGFGPCVDPGGPFCLQGTCQCPEVFNGAYLLDQIDVADVPAHITARTDALNLGPHCLAYEGLVDLEPFECPGTPSCPGLHTYTLDKVYIVSTPKAVYWTFSGINDRGGSCADQAITLQGAAFTGSGKYAAADGPITIQLGFATATCDDEDKFVEITPL